MCFFSTRALYLVDGRVVNLFYEVDWENLDVRFYRSELADGWEGAYSASPSSFFPY